MLVSVVEVLSCENPWCRKFGQIIEQPHKSTFYYCPVCGTVSKTREVNSALASSPERYKEHLRKVVGDPHMEA